MIRNARQADSGDRGKSCRICTDCTQTPKAPQRKRRARADISGQPALACFVLPDLALISEPHEKSAQEVSNESPKVLPRCFGWSGDRWPRRRPSGKKGVGTW